MTDVRLTATNPEDSSVVPVACNAKGELLLEEPTVNSDDYVAKTGDTMTGSLAVSASYDDRDIVAYSAGYDPGFNLGFRESAVITAKGGIYLDSDGNASSLSNKIALNSTDGSATFAGTVDVDGGNDIGVNLWEGGNIRVRRGSVTKDPVFAGENNDGTVTVQLNADGSGTFAGNIDCNGSRIRVGGNPVNGVAAGAEFPNNGAITVARASGGGIWQGYTVGTSTPTSTIDADGSATFADDVVVGSRSKQWMLVEQNGLCHMVEQIRATTADLVDPAAAAEYPPLRDVFGELDLIQKALREVMDRLRMNPPAGWPVWDGSDENS